MSRKKVSNLLTGIIGIFYLLSINPIEAQRVKFGKNFINISSSALLELEDSNKALLLTRVFNPNTSIKNPWRGMIVFDSTINKLAYYSGTEWIYTGTVSNIYNSDGMIENTTNNQRTISRKNNLILFVDSTIAISSPFLGDQQMKTYDTITFGKYGRVGIGTTEPKGKLDVRGPVYIYADHTNNTGFNDLGFGYVKNPLPALVIQPDTIAPITDINTRTIFISLFNRKYPNLYPGLLGTGTVYVNSPVSNNVAFKEGRVDIGFLGNVTTDSNLFTIWNRSTTAGGISLRTGNNALLRMNNSGEIGITSTDKFVADTATLAVNTHLTNGTYLSSTRNRYPLLINSTIGKTGTIGSFDSDPLLTTSKIGILFTQSNNKVAINNNVNLPEKQMAYLWTVHAVRPVMGISTYFANNVAGFNETIPYPDLPVSNLYETIRFYIEQPLRGSIPGLVVNDSNYKYQHGITSVKIVNLAGSRYSKLAFAEQDLSSKWQLMKMGQNIPTTSTYFLPSFIGKNPNDFYIVKDSSDPWIQFVYAGNKIIFNKSIDLPSAPNIISDQRIKRLKNKVEIKNALEKINAINIVEYTMKKDTGNQKILNRGVIAQEVEKIFPEAVTTSTTTHPLSASNIEEYAKSFRVDSSNKKQWYIDIALPDHGLQKEDKLYLKSFNLFGNFAPNYLQEKVIEIVDKDRFKLLYSEELANAKKLYIIGQEIKDLKTVDYNYLNMTNIAATQALSKELEEANKKIKTLEEDIAEMKQIIKKLSKASSK